MSKYVSGFRQYVETLRFYLEKKVECIKRHLEGKQE